MPVIPLKLVPVWYVEIPLELPDRWLTVCTCEAPAYVADVVRILCAFRVAAGDQIRVRVEVREVTHAE